MTVGSQLRALMIEALAKHLPPSPATMRVIDVNGETAQTLASLRDDVEIIPVPGDSRQWCMDDWLGIDAIVAYAYVLNDDFLQAALTLLRPGGRLIVVDPLGEVRKSDGIRLEALGYVRILVEAPVEYPLAKGVLIRGEKQHTSASTLDRIQQVADKDNSDLQLNDYRGRYLYLLISQTPNVPIWVRKPDDPLRWQAVTVALQKARQILAFSSLPKAVAFMQPAVLENKIVDINKVGKFNKDVILGWQAQVLLNPDVSILADGDIMMIDVDPETAEAPDE